MKKDKMCNSCPFNYGHPESEKTQNYGCLPGPSDILKIKDDTGNNWACHSNNKKVCTGLSQRRNTGIGKLHLQPGENYKLISYSEKDLQPILKTFNK